MRKSSLFTLVLSLMALFNTACATEQSADTFRTNSGKEVVITPIKHASMRISYNGLEIEVDPVISYKPQTDYSKLPKADIILVTHEHYDHCDKQAVADLKKSGTVIIANPNSAKILGEGDVMQNGDSKTLSNGISVEAVPAYNNSPEKLKFHPKGRDNGYILTIDGLRIYIAGDTEDIPEMRSIKDIDVAFLPCNLPYTMSPDQLKKAALMFKPKVLYPYHYSETKIEEVSSLLNDSGIDVRIRNFQ